jgi:hypothetical protein
MFLPTSMSSNWTAISHSAHFVNKAIWWSEISTMAGSWAFQNSSQKLPSAGGFHIFINMYTFHLYFLTIAIGCSERRLIGHSFYYRQLPAKALRHLPRKMPPRGIMYWEVWYACTMNTVYVYQVTSNVCHSILILILYCQKILASLYDFVRYVHDI